MQATARTIGVRISPRKVRLVADAIRNMPVTKALALLSTTQKHGASVLIKTVKSAVANAMQKENVQPADLFIVRLEVDGGSTLRRMHIGSRSHVRMYTKRSTHVRVVVGDKKDSAEQNKEVQIEKKVAVKKVQSSKKETKEEVK